MTGERLHLRQSSMQFSDPREQITQDALAVLLPTTKKTAPDSIAFSEATRANNVGPILERIAEERGYAWHNPQGDVAFAVHPRNELVEKGYVHVLDANGGNPKGNYSARGIAFVTYRTPAGNLVTCHSTHWLTGYRLDRHEGEETRREVLYDQQTAAMIEQVVLHGSGSRLSFWQGDTNVDEARDTGWDPDGPGAQFKEAGLVSIWDALADGKGNDYPGTHGGGGRTIDIIGHYAKDRRVKPLEVKVGRARNSDHRQVDAFYELGTARAKKS